MTSCKQTGRLKRRTKSGRKCKKKRTCKNGRLKTPPLEEMSPRLDTKIFNETMIIKRWED